MSGSMNELKEYLGSTLGLLGAMSYAWMEMSPEQQEIKRIQLQSVNSITWVIFQLRLAFPIDERTPQQNCMIAQACYEAAMLANYYNYQGHYAFEVAKPNDKVDDYAIQGGE